MKALFSFAVSFLFMISCIEAQLVFEGSEYMVDNHVIHSGVAMGFSDLNGDALDDLILLDDTKELYVIYQTHGFAERHVNFISRISNSPSWSLQLADVDNNGIQDIFIGNSELTIFKSEGMFPDFTRTTVNALPFLTQGSNFADMDADGDVDLFVCNDDAANFVALNDGMGNFTSVPTIMDFSTDPPSDGSGNYGTVWCDYDRDGDVDLYISKCRLGTSPGDPERTNQFFENTPMGFQRMYDYPELLSNDQSWVADFIDVDNDGDWDLLLANHAGEPMNLFIQQPDGSFIDEAPQRGIDFVAAVIQLVSGDYDNDGDVDIFAVGTDHIMFENDGTGHFSDGSFPEADDQIESATTGDYNNDGKLDIYAGYANIYNNPSNIPDQLFINNTDAGNYIKFSLRGENSNRFAIGTTVEIFHEASRQMREIRSGESYGINKTNIVHFGLGTINEIDSVKIFWPAGTIETFYNLSVNKIVQITEGKGVLDIPMNGVEANKTSLCEGDSISLTAPLADSYQWSTGDTTSQIIITERGVYTVKVAYGDQWVTLPSFQVVTESAELPNIEVDGPLLKCQSEIVRLFSDGEYPIMWNNNTDNQSLDVYAAGQYYFIENRVCGLFSSDTITVENILVSSPEVVHDTVLKFESAQLVSSDIASHWTLDTIDQQIIHVGNRFDISSLVNDSIVFTATPKIIQLPPEALGVIAPDTDRDGYHNTSLSGGMLFSTLDDCTIISVDVQCRVAGPRTILILNEADDEVYRQLFDLQLGKNTLVLNVNLPGGQNFEMTTDSDENIINLGFRSPDLMRSTGTVNYPFIGNSIAIVESTFGTGQYYYFYNWMMAGEEKLCYSYWQPAFAIVDGNAASQQTDSKTTQVVIFPNPSSGSVNIELEVAEDWRHLEIFDMEGKCVKQFPVENSNMLAVRALKTGIYTMKFYHRDGRVVIRKLAVL
jgi:hypothetical protein